MFFFFVNYKITQHYATSKDKFIVEFVVESVVDKKRVRFLFFLKIDRIQNILVILLRIFFIFYLHSKNEVILNRFLKIDFFEIFS